jgi:hypothetical protein
VAELWVRLYNFDGSSNWVSSINFTDLLYQPSKPEQNILELYYKLTAKEMLLLYIYYPK